MPELTTTPSTDDSVTISEWEWEDSDTGYMVIEGRDAAGNVRAQRFFEIDETATEIRTRDGWQDVEHDPGHWGNEETLSLATEPGTATVEIDSKYDWRPVGDSRLRVVGKNNGDEVLHRVFTRASTTVMKVDGCWVSVNEDTGSWGADCVFTPNPIDAAVSSGGREETGDRVAVMYKHPETESVERVVGHVDRAGVQRDITVLLEDDRKLRAEVTGRVVKFYGGEDTDYTEYTLLDISRLPNEVAMDGQVESDTTSLSLMDAASVLKQRADSLPFARAPDAAYADFLTACGLYGDAIVRERTVNGQGRISVGRPLAGEDVLVVCLPLGTSDAPQS